MCTAEQPVPGPWEETGGQLGYYFDSALWIPADLALGIRLQVLTRMKNKNAKTLLFV